MPLLWRECERKCGSFRCLANSRCCSCRGVQSWRQREWHAHGGAIKARTPTQTRTDRNQLEPPGTSRSTMGVVISHIFSRFYSKSPVSILMGQFKRLLLGRESHLSSSVSAPLLEELQANGIAANAVKASVTLFFVPNSFVSARLCVCVCAQWVWTRRVKPLCFTDWSCRRSSPPSQPSVSEHFHLFVINVLK